MAPVILSVRRVCIFIAGLNVGIRYGLAIHEEICETQECEILLT